MLFAKHILIPSIRIYTTSLHVNLSAETAEYLVQNHGYPGGNGELGVVIGHVVPAGLDVALKRVVNASQGLRRPVNRAQQKPRFGHLDSAISTVL